MEEREYMINDIPSTLAMSSQPIQVADPWHCPVNRRGVGLSSQNGFWRRGFRFLSSAKSFGQ